MIAVAGSSIDSRPSDSQEERSDISYTHKTYCSDFHHRQHVALNATVPYMKPLAPTQWVALAIKSKGLKQAELQRLMAQELPALEDDRSIVNKIINKKRGLSAEEMMVIERVTGFPMPSEHTAEQVPIVDWVTAGTLKEPSSQVEPGSHPTLAVAGLGRGNFIGLHVAGDSMDRVSPEGSIIIVDLADRTLINGKCYIFAIRGETTYKVWNSEPAYLAPNSSNNLNKPIFFKHRRDLSVIGRVRRTVLDL